MVSQFFCLLTILVEIFARETVREKKLIFHKKKLNQKQRKDFPYG